MNVFGVRENERVCLFIDGPNFYAATKDAEYDIDFRRLRNRAAERCKLIRANYYTGVIENGEPTPFTKMLDWLDYNGYAVHTKPVKTFQDAEGNRKIKGNMDVDIAVHMMETAPTYDHAILFSGDGDFRPLVEALQRMGKMVTVVSCMRDGKNMVADELRRQSDFYVDLVNIREYIGKNDQRG